MTNEFKFEILKIAISALENERSISIIQRELGLTDNEMDAIYEEARDEFDKLV